MTEFYNVYIIGAFKHGDVNDPTKRLRSLGCRATEERGSHEAVASPPPPTLPLNLVKTAHFLTLEWLMKPS